MDDAKLVDRIALRQEKLRAAAVSLKAHFVGIDGVIDKIISSIEAWYCTPELMTRPTIVCLWGLTGIGKTDLVRRLMRHLEVMDRFVEIQMTNKGSSQHTYSTTLRGLLGSSNISSEDTGVLLLDEIQRFRSVDNDGKDIHDYYFQDLWMLLSDGSFGSASDNKQEIMELLLEALYWEDYHEASKAASKDKEKDDEEKDAVSKRKFKQSWWQARQLKRRLRLTETVEEIMKWDSSQKINVLTAKLNDKSIYEPEIYSKLLVFISGNLDEAFLMADQTEETDVDADIFHKHSLRINLLRIKTALRNRFKPEQIARFGNTHVIYPALSRASYSEIIRRKVAEIIGVVEKTSGVRFEIDQSVYDAIYRNGVFPVQGTRPVFSTISSFFESVLPYFLIKALQNNVKKIDLSYKGKHLLAQIGKDVVSIRNEGDIDKIKQSKRNIHQLHKVAVHEAGHAITYGRLFGYVPTQVAVNVASEDKNGFVGLHAIDTTKSFLLYKIAVFMAGRVAEELVFGKDNVNGGASGDIEQATTIAANYHRLYGMGTTVSRIDIPGASHALYHNLDYKESDEQIEKIISEQKAVAEGLLMEHLPLIHEMSDHLVQHEKIECDDYIAMCKRHGITAVYLDAKEIVFPRYKDIYDRCWENRKEETNAA